MSSQVERENSNSNTSSDSNNNTTARNPKLEATAPTGKPRQRELSIDPEQKQQLQQRSQTYYSTSTPSSGKNTKRGAAAAATSGSAIATKKSEGADCGDSFTIIDVASGVEVAQLASAARLDASESAGDASATPKCKQSANSTAKPCASELAAQFDKINYQQATNELNNNSIPPTPPSKQLAAAQVVSSSAALQTSNSSARSQQPPPTLTPLNLLTGLRMHASNLKSQQQQQKAAAPQTGLAADAGADSNLRKPLLFKSDEGDSQQVGGKSAQPSGKSSTSPPAPSANYVESSLNPPHEQRTSSRSSPPTRNNVPPASYTSLFSLPLASSPSPPVGVHHERLQSLSRETTQIRSTTTTTTTKPCNQRSPLVKQKDLGPSSQLSDSLSSRNLFANPRQSTQRSSAGSDPNKQRLPTIFNHSSGWLKETFDYDQLPPSRKQIRSKLVDDYCEDDYPSGREVTIGEDDRDDQQNSEDDDDADDDQVQNSDSDKITPEPYGGPRHLIANLRGDRSNLLLDNGNKTSNRRLISASVSSSPETNRRGSSAKLSGGDSSKNHTSSRLAMSGKSQNSASGRSRSSPAVPQAQRARVAHTDELLSRPPSFNTTTNCRQLEHERELKAASCRKLDLLEQVAHLDCDCHICSKNRKLANLHDSLYHFNHQQLMNGSTSKLQQSSVGNLNAKIEYKYPKTRFVHMILKSVILVLCTLLLLLLLVGAILISHYLPQSMDKVLNVSRSFNVTIAGRR